MTPATAMAFYNNPWAVTNFQTFGGPYDEDFMTYWSNGGYGGGYGGLNNPMMIYQNGYNRGWTEGALYEYLYGRHRHHHRRGGHRSMHLHQHGNGINNIGQFQQLSPWGHLLAGPRTLEGADMMGLAAFVGGMRAPMIQCMGW